MAHAVDPRPARPSRAWYVLAALPGVIAAIVVTVSALDILHEVELRPRFVVPASLEVELPAGRYTGYGETRSRVEGVDYHASSFAVRCTSPDVQLETPPEPAQYSVPNFEGESIFLFSVTHPGPIHFVCDGGDRAVLSVGLTAGNMRPIWTILIAMFCALPLTGILGYLVHRRLTARARGL